VPMSVFLRFPVRSRCSVTSFRQRGDPVRSACDYRFAPEEFCGPAGTPDHSGPLTTFRIPTSNAEEPSVFPHTLLPFEDIVSPPLSGLFFFMRMASLA